MKLSNDEFVAIGTVVVAIVLTVSATLLATHIQRVFDRRRR